MPQVTVEAIVKFHTENHIKQKDIMFHHELFSPYCGWVVVYEHGNDMRAAFVKVGPGTPVEWTNKLGPTNHK